MMNFMEGVEVLRELCETTVALREWMSQQRYALHLAQEQDGTDSTSTFNDMDWSVSLMSSLVAMIKGDEEKQSFEALIHNNTNIDSSDSSYVQDCLCHSLIEIASVFDLNVSLIPSLFQYFLRPLEGHRGGGGNSPSLSSALLDTLEASLHEAITSCFETPDLLVPNSDPPLLLSEELELKSPSQDHSPGLVPTQAQLPDEVSMILQQLASLREESSTQLSSQLQQLGQGAGGGDDADPTQWPTNQNVDEDWVTYYDDSSGRYYLYSECRGESKWIDT
jgi:hypothetical protein